ncbi:MAG: Fic family protein [Lactobacillus sp.]|jgi:Fic family protein|nr:Fic family protein [Lactobacillus sp.]MCH3906352.1 Fic family protein [Lactobacillus sp.]MCH3990075.1 Fic family protein [Lactobacillus sp.]MCH4069211.1 Fic family protein [Lactobacillus sp.]MCI1303513.1 Fic family protein [Lactobacillus sp.]
MYPDKFHLTQEQNRRFANKNLVRLVFTNSRFEGLNTTLPQTQTIIDGMSAAGVSIDDTNVIVQLKRAWQYVIRENQPLSLTIEQNINLLVARYDSLDPGNFRTSNVSVELGKSQGEWQPPQLDLAAEGKFFSDLMNRNTSVTDKAITLLYHNMRNQLFWDGNKRTATLAANKLMIDHGAGLINIPLDKWDHWNKLISQYYLSGQMQTLKEWTYQNGIQGITLTSDDQLPKPTINPDAYE